MQRRFDDRRDDRSRPERRTRGERSGKRQRKDSPLREKRPIDVDDVKEIVEREVKRQWGGEVSKTDIGWVANLVKTPFTRSITDVKPPSQYVLPKFDLYDGMTDPMDHVMHYKNVMTLLSLSSENREATMCKSFGSSLKGVALAWYNGLEAESIDSFEALVKKFRKQFATSIKFQKESDYLYTIKQKKNESLGAYAQRFNKEMVGIPNCVEAIAVEAYWTDLIIRSKCYDDLTGFKSRSMVESLSRNLEEDRKLQRAEGDRPKEMFRKSLVINKANNERKVSRSIDRTELPKSASSPPPKGVSKATYSREER